MAMSNQRSSMCIASSVGPRGRPSNVYCCRRLCSRRCAREAAQLNQRLATTGRDAGRAEFQKDPEECPIPPGGLALTHEVVERPGDADDLVHGPRPGADHDDEEGAGHAGPAAL